MPDIALLTAGNSTGRQNDQQNRSWFGWKRTNCIHKALTGRILILLMMALAFPGAAAQAMTVGFFTGAGGLGDDAFTDSAYSGLRKAQQIHGFRLIVEEPGPSGKVSAKNAERIINQCDVLVMLGSQHSDLAAKYAPLYPSKRFFNFDDPIQPQPNLGSIIFKQHEGSFLAGDMIKAVETIQASGSHLLDLINDILDISKIEAGQIDLHPTPFDLNSLLLNLSRMFELPCKQKGLNWRVEAPGSNGPTWVQGDMGKLQQVLINLLGNAIKFTDGGDVTLKVNRIENNRYRFTVSDTGAGLTAVNQKAIFKPFYRVKDKTSSDGTGLGLSIAKRYIELMGGSLEFVSEHGLGSIFHFSIELPQGEERSADLVSADYTRAQGIIGRRVSALIVDDDSDSCSVLATTLEQIGVQVDIAPDGDQALAFLETQCPDIVFMDRYMPTLEKGARNWPRPYEPECKTIAWMRYRRF